MKDDTDHLWNVTQNKGVLILNNYDVDNAITTENISFCLFPIDHLNFITFKIILIKGEQFLKNVTYQPYHCA